MSALRLVVFDVDGTLVDSQSDILAAMTHAFDSIGHPMPTRLAVLGIVGLSLDVAMARLAPDLDLRSQEALVQGYKDSYMRRRVGHDSTVTSPMYPYAREILDQLHAIPKVLLGVATGKSNRGLRALIDGYGLHNRFVTMQTADDHPSKPHPSMLLATLAETGVAPQDAVMVGDTSYDIEMAQGAGMRAIGVSWGYHNRDVMGAAAAIIDDFRDLPATLDNLWGQE